MNDLSTFLNDFHSVLNAPVFPTLKRFDDENGDIEVIKKKVFNYLDNLKPVIKCAVVQQDGTDKVPDDANAMAHYPLRIYAMDGTVLMIPEVRTGYHGASSCALLDILQYAGFKLDRTFVDTIFNEKKVRLRVNF
jgi:hypothetical protein